MDQFVKQITSYLPNLLVGILLLILAFVVASIAKSVVLSLLKALKVEQYLDKLGVKDQSTGSSLNFVANLAWFVVFLLFLPGVLSRLGLTVVATPITNMVSTFLNFIPKLVAAIIIVALGIFIANVVRQLLLPILKAAKIDSLQEKAGIKASEGTTFSAIITNLVYALIILVVVISALQALDIPAVSAPAVSILNQIFGLFPNILGAIIILAVGIYIAKIVSTLLEGLLAGLGIDQFATKAGVESLKKVKFSRTIAAIVKYVLLLLFLVEALDVVGLGILSRVGNAIIAYIPSVLIAVIVAAIALFAANAVEALIVKKNPAYKASALVAKVAILVFAAFIILSELGIGKKLIETTFILILAAVCVAAAIAFGVGGRTFAAHMLEKFEKKMDDNK